MTKNVTGYATVSIDDGDNYRDIASTMTKAGYPMNHSSARNYVIRTMKKFVNKLSDNDILPFQANTEARVDAIAKSSSFQSCMSDFVQQVSSVKR